MESLCVVYNAFGNAFQCQNDMIYVGVHGKELKALYTAQCVSVLPDETRFLVV